MTACTMRLESPMTCGQILANYVHVKKIPSFHRKSFHSFCTLFYSATPKHPLILDCIHENTLTHIVLRDTFQETAPVFPLELLKHNLLLCHPLLQTIRNTTWITACQDCKKKKKGGGVGEGGYHLWSQRNKEIGDLGKLVEVSQPKQNVM